MALTEKSYKPSREIADQFRRLSLQVVGDRTALLGWTFSVMTEPREVVAGFHAQDLSQLVRLLGQTVVGAYRQYCTATPQNPLPYDQFVEALLNEMAWNRQQSHERIPSL